MPKPLFTQMSKTTLHTSITAAEVTSIVLKKLIDIYGNALAMSDFQSNIYLTIEPGSDNEEIISCTDFTVNSDGTVDLDTGIVRGLAASSPYGATGISRSHASGSIIVVSNNPQLLNSMLDFVVNKEDNQTIAGKKTFSTVPSTPSAPIAVGDLANKAYVDALAIGVATSVQVVVEGIAGTAIADGELIYFDSVTAKAWMLCDADIASTVQNVLLGIAQGVGVTAGAIAGGVMLRGVDDAQAGLVAGNIMYAGNTAGTISPTPGTKNVTIGIVPSGETTKVYFSPRFNQMITEDQQNALLGSSGTPSATNKYVTNKDTATSGASSKIIRANINGKLDGSWLNSSFGGDGSDGVLNISSGITTIDCLGASFVTLNYLSVSITGTAKLLFTNGNNSTGTVVTIKSQGDVVITSTDPSAIDLKGLGGGTGSPLFFSSGVFTGYTGSPVIAPSGSSSKTRGYKNIVSTDSTHIGLALSGELVIPPTPNSKFCLAGGNGNAGQAGWNAGNGTGVGGSAGTGGKGGGALIIECNGSWDFTSVIDSNGGNGGNGGNGTIFWAGGSGGSGGAGGNLLVLYNILISNSGTFNSSGGSGGSPGTGSYGVPVSGATGGTGMSIIVKNEWFA